MDVVGSVVGIASLGVQICQGLLSYCNSWKGYKNDLAIPHDCIADICRMLTLSQELLGRKSLNVAGAAQVSFCLDSCVDGPEELQKKLQKLQASSALSDLRQKYGRRFNDPSIHPVRAPLRSCESFSVIFGSASLQPYTSSSLSKRMSRFRLWGRSKSVQEILRPVCNSISP